MPQQEGEPSAPHAAHPAWQSWLARWAEETPIQQWVEAQQAPTAAELLAATAHQPALARLLACRPQARAEWVYCLSERIAATQAQQAPPRARILDYIRAGGLSRREADTSSPDIWVERYLAHNRAALAAAQSLARGWAGRP